ncbi:MAG: hypothetical protein ABL955_11900 [Elusimicrobiota bacterium]
MTKRQVLVAVLLLVAPFAQSAGPLVGVWNKDGAPYAELRADHTGQVGTEAVKWAADARSLTLTYENGKKDKMSFLLNKNILTIIMDGEMAIYTRGESKSAGPKPKTAKAPLEKAGKDKLSTLLLSSSWCSFRYNKISGASHQERVSFRPNGSWDSGARSESYSSGAGGTVSGQSDTSSGGRWQVKGTALLMSRGGGALEDTGLSVSRNSNGYPILNTGGKEYSSCN